MRRRALRSHRRRGGLRAGMRARKTTRTRRSSSRQAPPCACCSGTGAGRKPISAGTFLVRRPSPIAGRFACCADGRIVNLVTLEAVPVQRRPARDVAGHGPRRRLQAQAICARTYVLQRSNPRRDYDLVPSEADQVYGGIARESPMPGAPRWTRPPDRCCAYGNAFAQIAYSSCCGGHTEVVVGAWGSGAVSVSRRRRLPVLQRVAELPLDRRRAGRRDRASLWRGLGGDRRRFATCASPLRCQRTSDGRATGNRRRRNRDPRQRVPQRSGEPRHQEPAIYAAGDDRGRDAHAEGGGLGHGVGLCQWGARGYASRGGTADEIVGFYFPGTVIGNA